MRRLLPAALLALCLAVSAAPRLHAQSAPSPDAAPQGPAADPNGADDQAPVTTFKADVNLVSLYFSARDKRGILIPNLNKDDCTVFEEHAPQKLKNFTRDTDQPLTLGILLD